ncbi:MAG: hypothetical protein RSA41_08345 [Christensenella sp.]
MKTKLRSLVMVILVICIVFSAGVAFAAPRNMEAGARGARQNVGGSLYRQGSGICPTMDGTCVGTNCLWYDAQMKACTRHKTICAGADCPYYDAQTEICTRHEACARNSNNPQPDRPKLDGSGNPAGGGTGVPKRDGTGNSIRGGRCGGGRCGGR